MAFELRPGQKPGDHPEFFRLPPPPGRSRESRIVLDARGRFWNGAVPIDHAGMAVAFASWIRRHPDDRRFILTNGYDWTYFTVEDTPYFVRSVAIDGAEARLTLFDGTEELLDPETLSASDDGILYARVKGGAFEARFTPGAQASLVDAIVEGDGGAPALTLGGRQFPIPRRKPVDPCRGPSPGLGSAPKT